MWNLFDIITTNQIWTVLILTCLTLLLLITHKLTRQPTNLPPGPTPLPIIGNLIQMRGRKDEAIKRLRKQYGDIYMFEFGSRLTIGISSYKVIREALVSSDICLGRPPVFPCFRTPVSKGVLVGNGKNWRDHRRFSLHHLRDLGFGKVTMEENIHTETEFLMDAIQDKSGRPSDIAPLLRNAVSNITCILILGQRYSYTNKEFQDLIQRVDEIGATPTLAIGHFFPCLLHLPFGFNSTRKIIENTDVLRGFIQEKVREHRASFSQDFDRDLIDVYIRGGMELQETIEGTIFEEEEIVEMVFDMFKAGTETTTSIIRWGLLYLMLHQDVQQRMRQEIEDVVGCARLPSMKDKAELHYTQAVMTEILRLTHLIPFPVHSATENVKICGYDIPKNAIILPDFVSILRDENEFAEPHKFHPERFLDGNGHFSTKKQERVITFGLGKRDCLGKSLAKTEFFLFFTSLVQRFQFDVPANEPNPSLIGTDGIVHAPEQYLICATEITMD